MVKNHHTYQAEVSTEKHNIVTDIAEDIHS